MALKDCPHVTGEGLPVVLTARKWQAWGPAQASGLGGMALTATCLPPS